MRRAVARATAGALRLSLRVSPQPMALAIRRGFAAEGERMGAAMLARAPRDVEVLRDLPYGGGRDEVMDVYRPPGEPPQGGRPLVVWIHGGAWIAGSKEEIEGWLRMIAARGPVVAAPRYSLAPGARYPTPVRQVAAAAGRLLADAPGLGIDPARVVLGGDSAGAQLAAQAAALATGPAYAARVGITMPIPPEALRGVVLMCGVFDLGAFPRGSALEGFLTAVGWSYSGRRDFRADEDFVDGTSVVRHLTAAFPPSLVAAGDADPLETQSRALAARLRALGVETDTVFHAPGHGPPLGHEYQFDVALDGAHATLERVCAFIGARTA